LGERFIISSYPYGDRDDIKGFIIPDMVRKWGMQDISTLPEMHKRDQLLTSREDTTCRTHIRNTYVPEHIPQLATGIKKVQLPEKMWNELVTFLDKHFHRSYDEEWEESQTQLNYFEKPTRLIYLDWDPELRDRLAKDYIMPLIVEWSGIHDLEFMAFYGIREYVNGSWLRGHIDRLDTHVLSATMTIRTEEQGGDWPLEVVMPDGTRQKLTTEPGSLILYESAKIIHGRPSVFNGKFQYSCFVHYRPKTLVEGRHWNDIASSGRDIISSNQHRCNKIKEYSRHNEL